MFKALAYHMQATFIACALARSTDSNANYQVNSDIICRIYTRFAILKECSHENIKIDIC